MKMRYRHSPWKGLVLPVLLGIGLLSLDHPDASAQGSVGSATFAKDVAPILQENCQVCHRPGMIAPMSLLTYEDARPWASSIRDKVSSRKMPPWPLDKTMGIQEFKNDISLTDTEIATVVQWVDAGAPLGDRADLPPPVKWPDYANTWRYEERFNRPPDVVITSPAYTVIPNGRDQWPNPQTIVEGLTEERWIKAIEIKPGNPESRYVFHHANPSLMQDGERSGLISSAVGKEGEIFPDDTGKLIKPGATVNFGMHFYPIGEEVDAVMVLGLWLYPKEEMPKFVTPGQAQFRTDMTTGKGGFPGHAREIARRADLLIPPNSHAMYRSTYVLDKPARIHDLRGHMHLRGQYQMVEAVYPNGQSEIINKLNWDHGWHTTFVYEDHVRPLLPKGTVLILTSVFDNTANNHHNPDPDQWVVAGSRTVDEMAHIWIGITYFDDEKDFDRLVNERQGRPSDDQ